MTLIDQVSKWTINLETAVGPSQKVQGFESESFALAVEHSQTVKATTSANDYGAKDCAFRPAPTAVFRIKDQHHAATVIQSRFRGFLVRKESDRKKSLLPWALFAKVKPDLGTVEQFTRARHGDNPVYIAKDVVIKNCGQWMSSLRFKKMKHARDICIANGYTHLVIPTARVHDNFIIERRLPITDVTFKEQIGLYYDNPETFTEAIKEFAGLVFQSVFTDLCCRDWPHVGRYDNVSLYVVQKKGFIGLVDLEHFFPIDSNTKKYQSELQKCLDLIYLFPLHFDVIIEVAKRFNINIVDNLQLLERERKTSLGNFAEKYLKHKKFLCKRGITFDNEKLKLQDHEKKLIVERLSSCIQSAKSECWWESFFSSCSCDSITEKVPELIEETVAFINSHIKKPEGINSYGKLVEARSLNLVTEWRGFITKIASQLEQFSDDDYMTWEFSKYLISEVFSELQKAEVIYYFQPTELIRC